MAIIIAAMASWFGRSWGIWFTVSLILGPLAFLILMILPEIPRTTAPNDKTHVRCPDCAELILPAAKVCKHCGWHKPTEQ